MGILNMEAIPSPRPTPKFFLEPQTFSTKKSRGALKDSLPPRPPVKSAPPLSRIFPHRPLQFQQRAQVVSFRSEDSNGSFLGGQVNNNKSLFFETGFKIICRIGAGSFGEVFKVRSKEDGKLYAVKKSQERFRGECDRKRKLEEVAKHESLPLHPNCVTFYRAWEERLHLYIQEELCRNSLSDYTEKNHEIAESRIWTFLVDLLMAVKHLHDHNLIHMDIKPENIFISPDEVCKLGDFGLVLDIAKSSDFSEAQEGDPKYLAPELMDGKFSKAADIFSLGMTILELASDLDLPRGGDGWHMLRSGQLPEEFLRDKSFDMKYVIQQMLDPDPSSRPTVDQVLAFPYVRKVWKKRKREYMMKSAMNTVMSMLHSFIQVILFLTTVFKYPYHYFRPPLRSDTSSHHSSSVHSSQSTGLGLDRSLSDDDCFEDDINIHNNSLGIPLDTSSSSESFLSEFSTQCNPRKAFTSPVLRLRPPSYSSPPLSSSPVLPTSSRKHLASPNVSFESSFEEERAVTPTLNSSANGLLDDDLSKTGIEPKNLMDISVDACINDLQKMLDQGVTEPDKPTFTQQISTDVVDGIFKQHHTVSKSKYNYYSCRKSFIEAIIDNINKRFPNKTLMTSFSIMGMRPITFLSDGELDSWGNEYLDILIQHFSREKSHTYDKVTTRSDPVVDEEAVKTEWSLMFEAASDED